MSLFTELNTNIYIFNNKKNKWHVRCNLIYSIKLLIKMLSCKKPLANGECMLFFWWRYSRWSPNSWAPIGMGLPAALKTHWSSGSTVSSQKVRYRYLSVPPMKCASWYEAFLLGTKSTSARSQKPCESRQCRSIACASCHAYSRYMGFLVTLHRTYYDFAC